jgi:hypothetical protein
MTIHIKEPSLKHYNMMQISVFVYNSVSFKIQTKLKLTQYFYQNYKIIKNFSNTLHKNPMNFLLSSTTKTTPVKASTYVQTVSYTKPLNQL